MTVFICYERDSKNPFVTVNHKVVASEILAQEWASLDKTYAYEEMELEGFEEN